MLQTFDDLVCFFWSYLLDVSDEAIFKSSLSVCSSFSHSAYLRFQLFCIHQSKPKEDKAAPASRKTAINLSEIFGHGFYGNGYSDHQKRAGDFLEPSCQSPFHMDWANDDQRQVCHEYQQLLPTQPRLSGIEI